MSTYNQQIIEDQKTHVIPWTYHIDNGNYVDLTAHANITWHYDLQQNSVIVDKLDLTLDRKNPQKRGGGFWDTFIFTKPQAPLPHEEGTFHGVDGDMSYVHTGQDVWDKMLAGRDDVYAYFSQNNRTEEYKIVYNLNNFQPYKAQHNSDGSWTLLSVFDRWNEHPYGLSVDILTVGWGRDTTSVKLDGVPPVKPTPQSTSTHYHYNTTNVYANRIIFSIILLSSLTCNSLITCKYVF